MFARDSTVPESFESGGAWCQATGSELVVVFIETSSAPEVSWLQGGPTSWPSALITDLPGASVFVATTEINHEDPDEDLYRHVEHLFSALLRRSRLSERLVMDFANIVFVCRELGAPLVFRLLEVRGDGFKNKSIGVFIFRGKESQSAGLDGPKWLNPAMESFARLRTAYGERLIGIETQSGNTGCCVVGSLGVVMPDPSRSLSNGNGGAYRLLVEFIHQHWQDAADADHSRPAALSSSGISRLFVLAGHEDGVNRAGWSPDGRVIGSSSLDRTVRIWDGATGHPLAILGEHKQGVYGLAWSPDSGLLVSGCQDGIVRVWDVAARSVIRNLDANQMGVYTVAWSPDGRFIAAGDLRCAIKVWSVENWKVVASIQENSDDVADSAFSPDGAYLATCSDDRTIQVWNGKTFELIHTLKGHVREVSGVAWSPTDKTLLASSSLDQTVRLWNVRTGRCKTVLEGHRGEVKSVAFSYDGTLMASKSSDGTIKLWDSDTWNAVADISCAQTDLWGPTLAFHPQDNLLLTTGSETNSLTAWRIDPDQVFKQVRQSDIVFHKSAKVVLVGDFSGGKTGLYNALLGQPFRPTESTHGRQVTKLFSATVEGRSGLKELREVYLWDLAGQPDYRPIHQIHFRDVTVAIVVFDGFNSTDAPKAIRSWVRALRQAGRERDSSIGRLRMLLVVARVDSRGKGLTDAAAADLIQELGFDGKLIATSAKEATGIEELRNAILGSIDWDTIPNTVSDELLERVKAFVDTEQRLGAQLVFEDDLFRQYVSPPRKPEPYDLIRTHFVSCLRRLETQGIIRYLNFGGLILFRPQLIDAYASALLIEARNHPLGLGSVPEEVARQGKFVVPHDRMEGPLEALLLAAVIEDLLANEIALRVVSDDGSSLIVFPSQVNRELPTAGTTVTYVFQGSGISVFTSLVVRIATAGWFARSENFKNAAVFYDAQGGTYGIRLIDDDGGASSISLFFNSVSSEGLQARFDEYVYRHIRRRAVQHSMSRNRHYLCRVCQTPINDEQAALARRSGRTHAFCPACGNKISLADEDPTQSQPLPAAAGEVACRPPEDYDLFVSYNLTDRQLVDHALKVLRSRGLVPWVAEEQLPGTKFIETLQQQLLDARCAVVFIGPNGVGKWQAEEIQVILSQATKRDLKVIPALLPGCPDPPPMNEFLRVWAWVDLRGAPDTEMDRLIAAIEKSRSRPQVA
jgi:small GTP-binding protein